MAESYCGKRCGGCVEKHRNRCPGCRVGPGRKYGGTCGISKCCVSKGQQSCEQCANASTCTVLRKKDGFRPTNEPGEEKTAEVMKQSYQSAAVLGRWLLLSFWLCICSNLADLILTFVGLGTDIRLIENVLNMAFSLMNLLALFKLAAASDGFRLCGVLTIIRVALTLLASLLYNEVLVLFVTLAVLVISIMAEYQQFMALIEVTQITNSELSEKWSNLWIIYFICLCASAVGVVLTALGWGLAALVTVVCALGALVAAIVKIVYLYRTAVFFRNLSQELQYWHLMS